MFNLFFKQRGAGHCNYFRNARAIVYVYDETDAQSFDDLQMWQMEAARFGADDLINFLIGNKHDLIEQDKPCPVPRENVDELAAAFGTNPMHISAETGSGCEEAFRYIARFLIEKFVFLHQNHHP